MPFLLSESPSARYTLVQHLEIFLPAASSLIFRTWVWLTRTSLNSSGVVCIAVTSGINIHRINLNKSAHHIIDVVKYPQECYVEEIFVLRNFIEVEFAKFMPVNRTCALPIRGRHFAMWSAQCIMGYFRLLECQAGSVNMAQTRRFPSRTCWLFNANMQLIREKLKGLFCW